MDVVWAMKDACWSLLWPWSLRCLRTPISALKPQCSTLRADCHQSVIHPSQLPSIQVNVAYGALDTGFIAIHPHRSGSVLSSHHPRPQAIEFEFIGRNRKSCRPCYIAEVFGVLLYPSIPDIDVDIIVPFSYQCSNSEKRAY